MGSVDPLRIGVVGTGSMAERHIAALARDSNVQVVGVAHTRGSQQRAQELCVRYGIGYSTTEFDYLIGRDDLDAVYICTPNALHKTQVVTSLLAGKHVFCEKPLGISTSDVAEMMTAKKRSAKTVMVGMNLRYRSQWANARAVCTDGRLGDLAVVRGSYVYNMVGTTQAPTRGWWLDRANGEFFLNSGAIHCIDLMRWIAGDVTQVFAQGRRTHETSGIAWRTTFGVSLLFERGIVGEFFCCALALRPNELSLEAIGSRGNWKDNEIWSFDGGQVVGHEKMPAEQPILDLNMQVNDFVRAVRTGQEPLNGIIEAGKNLAICDAIVRSSETGTATQVDYGWLAHQ